MARKETWESASLAWVHRVREDHYRKTKDLPVEAWLKSPDPGKALRACRRLGLKVRLIQPRGRRELRAQR
jgi:hypothetical protein